MPSVSLPTAAAVGSAMATAGSIASVAMPIIGAAGVALSALGSIQAGKQAAASARYNAQIQANNAKTAEQNATMAAHEGAANAQIEQLKTRAEVGAMKSSQAANGIDVNQGSPVDVRSSAAELGELNAINIRSNAARKAYGYQTEAADSTAQSQLDRSQAKNDEKAGYVQGGSTLLSGAYSTYKSGAWDKFSSGSSLNNAPLTMGPF